MRALHHMTWHTFSDNRSHYFCYVCTYPYNILRYSSRLKKEFLRLDRLMRGLFLPGLPTKLPDDVTLLVLAPQDILVRHESASNRPPHAELSHADPHLGAKTMAKTVLTFTNTSAKVDAAHKRATGYSRV
jgi:hypothetical protein